MFIWDGDILCLDPDLALCLGDGGGMLLQEAFGVTVAGGTAIGLTGGACGDTGVCGGPLSTVCGGAGGGPFGATCAQAAPAITLGICDRGTSGGGGCAGSGLHFAVDTRGLG